jgi:hypothetical protein
MRCHVAAGPPGIAAAGGVAETVQVDACDEQAADEFLASVVRNIGSIHVSFSAIGIPNEGVHQIPFDHIAVLPLLGPAPRESQW